MVDTVFFCFCFIVHSYNNNIFTFKIVVYVFKFVQYPYILFVILVICSKDYFYFKSSKVFNEIFFSGGVTYKREQLNMGFFQSIYPSFHLLRQVFHYDVSGEEATQEVPLLL